MTTSLKESNAGTVTTQPTVESTESTSPTLGQDTRDLCLDLAPITQLAEGKVVRIPRNPNFTRKDVVNAFQSAFELVGGVPRLALWANENYTEFTKLYARLLPSQSSSALGESNVLRIEMAIAPSALDMVDVPTEGHVFENEG